MNEHEWLVEQFEGNRAYLRGVAYRMLGSLTEADDAVQETWLRLSRVDADKIENLRGWLTTVTARVCLDMLRSRKSRREELLGANLPEPPADSSDQSNPEHEALLADSVGLALLVVLETLTPAERLAFVLHDLFAVPFDEIAEIIGRSTGAARQLASRARRKVRGEAKIPEADLSRQREVVEAFLAAARRGDFNALLAVLDPDVQLRTDIATVLPSVSRENRGAEIVARQAANGGARAAQSALVDGAIGVIVAPAGRLTMVLKFTVCEERITEIYVVADTENLLDLDLAILGN